MAFFTWKKEYNVGIPRVDEQHRELVRLLNELYEAMKMRKGNTVLKEVLTGLLDYTRTHFADEERLMKAYNYPALPAHKVEHDNLTKKVHELARDFNNGKITLSIELGEFLKNWLSNHILESDKRFGAYAKRQ